MIYYGIVENINDPLNAGRVQVRVYPFYRELDIKDLPWAIVERSTDLGQTSGRGLNQHNLMEGTQVTVEFLDQQMQQPIVRGIVPRESDFANMQSFTTHTIKFLNGSEITVDETPGMEMIKVIDPNKNFILLNTSGITIHVGDPSKKIQIESEGQVNMTSTSNMTITSSGNMKIDSSGNLDIKASGNTNLKSTGETTIDAAKLNLKNILGTSQLCSLPVCLFTGTKHQSPNSN
jgi:hypothetical protein